MNLLTALAKQPHAGPVGAARRRLPGGPDVSPDGRWIASSDDQNRMHLYDASTNRLLRSYDAGRPAEDEQAFMIGAFSPDSRQLAVILEVGGVHRAGAPAGPGHHAADDEARLPGGKPVWGSMSSSVPTAATWRPPC